MGAGANRYDYDVDEGGDPLAVSRHMLGILAVQLGAARGGHNQTSDRIACCCLRACITHCGD